MRRAAIISVIGIALLGMGIGAGIVYAQSSDEFKISRWVVSSSGGSKMGSSSYSSRGTLAQPLLGVMAGAQRYNSGGIWSLHHIAPWPVVTHLPEVPEIPSPDPFPEPDPQDPLWTPGIQSGSYFPPESSFTCPAIPAVVSIEFPETLGLPEMPTLTLLTYITSTYSPIISLTESIAQWDTVIELSKLLPEEIAGAMGISASWEYGETPDLNSLEFGGYTASEMASELVGGIDAALSYIRGLSSIGVIGPTAAALLVGLTWVAFVAGMKLVLGGIMLVVRFIVRIWELLPLT